MDPYHRVAYFSEDLGMNSFHYHWHVLHPSIWIKEFGELKDRMGELFYWVHRQMVARYVVKKNKMLLFLLQGVIFNRYWVIERQVITFHNYSL